VVELGVREKYHRRYAQPHVLEFGPRSSCTTSVRGVRSCIWSSWLVARPKTKTKMRFSSICSSSSIQHVISADCIITSMYNDAYATAFTNNPFISDPTNAQSRFPDLSNPSNDNQYTHWIQSLPNPYYQQQQQPQQQQRQQPQQPQQYGSNFQAGHFTPLPQQPTGMPFQPSSSFGQQLTANLSGSYGYLQGQGQPQQAEYNPVQQQLQSPTYIPQFDPYSSIGQGWDGQNQPQDQSRNQSHVHSSTTTGGYSNPSPSSSSISPSGDPHPREYIRSHKLEIEAWDSYAWKQLLNAFDALKNAWDGRAKELGPTIAQYQQQLTYGGGGYYTGQIQQEVARLQGVRFSFAFYILPSFMLLPSC
jgi:hypothetical protein